MLDTVQDVIDHFEAVKKQAGNIQVRVRCQLPFLVPVDTSIEEPKIGEAKLGTMVLIIHGYTKV